MAKWLYVTVLILALVLLALGGWAARAAAWAVRSGLSSASRRRPLAGTGRMAALRASTTEGSNR